MLLVPTPACGHFFCMKRDSYIFYRSFYDAINKLTEHQQLVLYRAITVYSLEGEEPEFEDNVLEAMFSLIKPQLTANNNRYANGKRGGRPRRNQEETKPKPNENQEETNTKPNENDNENVNENENDIIKPAVSKSIEERDKEFQEKLKPFLDKYGKDTLNKFYLYWSQKNENGKKMLWEMQKVFDIGKRLATWNGKNFAPQQSSNDGLYRNKTNDEWEQAKNNNWI